MDKRIAHGPLPIDDALGIAKQIAEALEAAHERGVIHRDLKPANIALTNDGNVKVLDFGLAKAMEPTSAMSVNAMNSPTLSMHATQAGIVLGTVAYMSPEQAKGKPVDKRTDIWAFGCVLFEMMTGRQAFVGENIADLVVAVITNEPEWSLLPPSTPPRVVELLKRCLNKDPRERLRDIGIARLELLWNVESSGPFSSVSSRATMKYVIPAIATSVALTAVITLVLAQHGRERRDTPVPVTRAEIALSPADSLIISVNPALAIAPSGSYIVYRGERADQPRMLFIRRLDEFVARPIAGTEGGAGPFFSPDGQWLGFFAFAKLRKLALSGGAPVPLADGPNNRGGSWGTDGTIVFTPETQGGTFRVPANGGERQPVSSLDRVRGEKSHRFPQILPGGHVVLVTTSTADIATWDQACIEAIEVKTGKRHVIVEGGSSALYVPTGHLLYAQGGALLATRFDLKRVAVTGTPIKVIDDILVVPSSGRAEYAVSENGTLVYASTGGKPPGYTLMSLDRQGRATPISESRQAYIDPMFSPAGDRLAVTVEAANDQIWVYDFERGMFTRLTSDWDNNSPSWTPDGRRIVFTSNRNGPPRIFWQSVDGSAPAEPLVHVPQQAAATEGRVTPDGRALVYVGLGSQTDRDLWMMRFDVDRTPRPLVVVAGGQSSPALSPDGRWLAYMSSETGRPEIYVRSFPTGGGRWQVSTDGGFDVRWPARGNEIFYRFGKRVYAARVTLTPAFSAERPRSLFETPMSFRGFDVAPDGQRFVMVAADETMAPTRLRLVMNFFDELRRRIPSD